jgi:hypothetical protein
MLSNYNLLAPALNDPSTLADVTVSPQPYPLFQHSHESRSTQDPLLKLIAGFAASNTLGASGAKVNIIAGTAWRRTAVPAHRIAATVRRGVSAAVPSSGGRETILPVLGYPLVTALLPMRRFYGCHTQHCPRLKSSISRRPRRWNQHPKTADSHEVANHGSFRVGGI